VHWIAELGLCEQVDAQDGVDIDDQEHQATYVEEGGHRVDEGQENDLHLFQSSEKLEGPPDPQRPKEEGGEGSLDTPTVLEHNEKYTADSYDKVKRIPSVDEVALAKANDLDQGFDYEEESAHLVSQLNASG